MQQSLSKKAMPKIITILSFHFPISILKKIYKNVSTVPLKKSNAKIITNSCYIRLTLRGVLVINNNEYVHILFVVTDLPLLIFYPIVHFIPSRTIKVINVTKVVRRLKIYTSLASRTCLQPKNNVHETFFCFQLYTMPGSSGEDSSSDLDETPSKTLPQEKPKTDSASAKPKPGTKLWGNHRFSNSQITRHANAGPPPR